METAATAGAAAPAKKQNQFLVIGASSVGSMFEWYDFFLYGTLVPYINAHFFSAVDPNTGFILALGAFAAGFLVRPFGALVFGWVGDMFGRKSTFLIAMIIMGASTFLVGLLPDYNTLEGMGKGLGVIAPIVLVLLRVFQGLAVGGQYGGAVTYVAEHAPAGKRGLLTSWIQITATVGLLASLVLIIVVRSGMGEGPFADWGWRIPFLVSIFLLIGSIWIRMLLNESPVYKEMKAAGAGTKAPFKEAFGKWSNLKFVIIALFGAVAGQACVWYSGTLYGLFFLQKQMKLPDLDAYVIMAVALGIGTPAYVFFGWLSDKIGRKPLVLLGLLLPAVTYAPIFPWSVFHQINNYANPALARAQNDNPVIVEADGSTCALQFDPVGKNKFDSTSCDIAKAYLSNNGVSYDFKDSGVGGPKVEGGKGVVTRITIGKDQVLVFDDPKLVTYTDEDHANAVAALVKKSHADDVTAAKPAKTDAEATAALSEGGIKAKMFATRYQERLAADLKTAGYPPAANPKEINHGMVIFWIALTTVFTAMIYGPMAAMLVELFPARIRYTSLSLPYHIGNGWFGGLLPTTAFMIVAATGNIFAGLWYPVIVAGFTFVVALFFLPETYKREIHH